MVICVPMMAIRVCLVGSFLFLQGCFFFATVPSSWFSSAQHCVPEVARVGTRVSLSDGRTGTVTALHGRSDRCQDGLHPILAEIEVIEDSRVPVSYPR